MQITNQNNRESLLTCHSLEIIIFLSWALPTNERIKTIYKMKQNDSFETSREKGDKPFPLTKKPFINRMAQHRRITYIKIDKSLFYFFVYLIATPFALIHALSRTEQLFHSLSMISGFCVLTTSSSKFICFHGDECFLTGFSVYCFFEF